MPCKLRGQRNRENFGTATCRSVLGPLLVCDLILSDDEVNTIRFLDCGISDVQRSVV
jgi:hypothetical protein